MFSIFSKVKRTFSRCSNKAVSPLAYWKDSGGNHLLKCKFDQITSSTVQVVTVMEREKDVDVQFLHELREDFGFSPVVCFYLFFSEGNFHLY